MTRRPGEDLKDNRVGVFERSGPGAEFMCISHWHAAHVHKALHIYTKAHTHSRVLSHLTVFKCWINLWSRHQSVLVFVHAGIYSTIEWPHKILSHTHSKGESQAWKAQISRLTQQEHSNSASEAVESKSCTVNYDCERHRCKLTWATGTGIISDSKLTNKLSRNLRC